MYSDLGPYKPSIEYSGMVHETITSKAIQPFQ